MIETTDATPPIPMEGTVVAAAERLKRLNLPWTPRAGCFVHDPDAAISAPSPFPHRIYFILSMPRFLRIFHTEEAMRRQLVWLPTWHQSVEQCRRWGIDPFRNTREADGTAELLRIYALLADHLRRRGAGRDYEPARSASPEERWIDAVMGDELGRLAFLPEETRAAIRSVYHQVGSAYLGWRRIQEQQPATWLPPETRFDSGLLNDLGHFYSDYQRVVQALAAVRRSLARLQAIDPAAHPAAYRDLMNRLAGRGGGRSADTGEIMQTLLQPS